MASRTADIVALGYDEGYKKGYADGGSDMEKAKQIIIDGLLKQIEHIRADAIGDFTRYLANNSELENVVYLYKASYLSEQLKE